MKTKFYLLTSMILLISCSESLTHIGDTSISIFDATHLYFDMDLKKEEPSPKKGLYRLDAGRVLLKKVTLPRYDIQTKVTITLRLKSNGDPWDKSGSFFVVPHASDLSLLDFESGNYNLTESTDSFPAVLPFIHQKNRKYLPNVELLRFMTPFGVGHFNNDERVKSLKPVYIPNWENEVVWKQDITHLLPLLENEVYLGVYIDTWSKEGYTLSAELNFEESTVPNHVKKEQKIIPIINTTKYVSDQKYFDAFSNTDIEIPISIEHPIKNAQLYYITTGHGGHEEGDEFTKKENIIQLNDSTVKHFIPWRDDCASFRRYNPSSGVWTEKTTWKGKEIDERIASSDYSRSNWCPGSDVKPEIIKLGNLIKGTHTFKFSIPEAQSIEGEKINYWMVSAYLVYDL